MVTVRDQLDTSKQPIHSNQRLVVEKRVLPNQLVSGCWTWLAVARLNVF